MADKFSSRFNSGGSPANGKVVRPIGGSAVGVGAIADLEADLNEFNGFVPVPPGARLVRLDLDLAEADTHATPAATAEVILRRVVAGVVTDTVLVDLSDGVQSALKAFYLLDEVVVGDDDNGYGIVGVKFDTAAATEGTGDNLLAVTYA